MLREFVLYSRTGRTGGKIGNLHEAGRLDVVSQCIQMALYHSYAMRKDVIFHALLNGPPDPPKEMIIDGRLLEDAPPNDVAWEKIVRKILSGGTHEGVGLKKNSLQALIDMKDEVYVLERKGTDLFEIDFGDNPVFILGDQIGLPKKEEKYALRKGRRVSLGGKDYTSAQCVCIINYVLDRKERK
ncbi:MAG: hypothetical protein QW083_02140 [Methanomassiliicoccales archaeon]